MIRLLFLVLVLNSCATKPVTRAHWTICEALCEPLFVKEACITWRKGPACKCDDGFVFYIEGDLDYD